MLKKILIVFLVLNLIFSFTYFEIQNNKVKADPIAGVLTAGGYALGYSLFPYVLGASALAAGTLYFDEIYNQGKIRTIISDYYNKLTLSGKAYFDLLVEQNIDNTTMSWDHDMLKNIELNKLVNSLNDTIFSDYFIPRLENTLSFDADISNFPNINNFTILPESKKTVMLLTSDYTYTIYTFITDVDILPEMLPGVLPTSYYAMIQYRFQNGQYTYFDGIAPLTVGNSYDSFINLGLNIPLNGISNDDILDLTFPSSVIDISPSNSINIPSDSINIPLNPGLFNPSFPDDVGIPLVPYTGYDVLNPDGSISIPDVTINDIPFDLDFPLSDVSNPDIPGNPDIPTYPGIDLTIPGDIALDFTPLTLATEGLTNKFPFSIPWDLKNSISSLLAEPQAPNWEINLDNGFVGTASFNIDFSMFEKWVLIFRWGLLIIFNVALIILTRKLIRG